MYVRGSTSVRAAPLRADGRLGNRCNKEREEKKMGTGEKSGYLHALQTAIDARLSQQAK